MDVAADDEEMGRFSSTRSPTDNVDPFDGSTQNWNFEIDRPNGQKPETDRSIDALREELRAFVARLRKPEDTEDPPIDLPSDHDRPILSHATAETDSTATASRGLADVISDSSEEEIQRGLKTIDELDDILRQKTIEQRSVSNDVSLDSTLAIERRKTRQERLEILLARERPYLKDIDRVKHALNDDHSSENGSHHRLKPEELQQLDAVMQMDESEFTQNPFDSDVQLDIDLPCEGNRTVGDSNGSTFDDVSNDAQSKSTSLYQSLRTDYLHQLRQEREMRRRLRDIDRKLRRLRTADIRDCVVSYETLTRLVNDARCDLMNNDIKVVNFAEHDYVIAITNPV